MNLELLSSEIVSVIRSSPTESPLNLAQVVKNRIEDEFGKLVEENNRMKRELRRPHFLDEALNSGDGSYRP